jgi:aryl-alcohol dehydrogenase-like predicted oxidoreductase
MGLESALELSVRLAISHPGVSTALVGYSDSEQLENAIRWTERGPLSQDQVRRVVEAAAS